MSRSLLAAVALLALASCGMSDDEERRRVLSELDRIRDMPTSHPPEMLAAAEALAAMPVSNEKTKATRDACTKAHIDRARMYALVQELEAAVKSPQLKGDPKVLAEKYKQADDLQQNLADELDVCSLRYSELLTTK